MLTIVVLRLWTIYCIFELVEEFSSFKKLLRIDGEACCCEAHAFWSPSFFLSFSSPPSETKLVMISILLLLNATAVLFIGKT